MKIALLGYGKMGKEIEKAAIQRGHEIILRIDEDSDPYDISIADIAIDFSIPDAAYENITNCIKNKVPVISGTTGWLDKYAEVKKLCLQKDGAFIYASNFSLGVNIFFELNRQLAKLMYHSNDYTVSVEEIHHTEKLDAPSGTAITLAEEIIDNSDKTNWGLNGTTSKSTIPIHAKRVPEVPGTHTISYRSDIDSIAIKHIAHNRKGFALGAVAAAEWLRSKKGVFTMKDVLEIG
ncbi:MAG: 4-hydroxy-tetrahydrodipicolinate reductase [Flavobacteriaceae bacterium]|nr:MAG: 4-hydroxy-tetrahydrodipicolinate reductase [Flavobacteriaceae bacterium]